MSLRALLKLVFSESAFLKAELDHIEALRAEGKAYGTPEEFRDEALDRIRTKRRNIIKSITWIISLVFLGCMAAFLVNTTFPFPWLWIRLIRALSVILLAWAVWSKVGDVQTFEQETLLELTSQYLYTVLYRAGLALGSFALFLEGTDSA